jgi:hypothetical protein
VRRDQSMCREVGEVSMPGSNHDINRRRAKKRSLTNIGNVTSAVVLVVRAESD